MTEADRKKERLKDVNAIITEMSRHGRRFFYCETTGRVAHMLFDPRGHLRFCDDYTGGEILVSYTGRWKKFSHGGTMRRLIEQMALYVRQGVKIPSGHFGPFPDYLCDGDLWGYGKDEMEKLRACLKSNAAIAWKEPAHA